MTLHERRAMASSVTVGGAAWTSRCSSLRSQETIKYGTARNDAASSGVSSMEQGEPSFPRLILFRRLSLSPLFSSPLSACS